MYQSIHAGLERQSKALALLRQLMDEEFSHLVEHQTETVMQVEFSIHELLRQIAREKESIIKMLGGGKVRDYAQMLPEEQGAALTALWHEIDELEQACARQATLNTELSLGLLDQSEKLSKFLHSRLAPPTPMTYGRRGAYTQTRPEAALISGSM